MNDKITKMMEMQKKLIEEGFGRLAALQIAASEVGLEFRDVIRAGTKTDDLPPSAKEKAHLAKRK